jgi:hypothetical protein
MLPGTLLHSLTPINLRAYKGNSQPFATVDFFSRNEKPLRHYIGTIKFADTANKASSFRCPVFNNFL